MTTGASHPGTILSLEFLAGRRYHATPWGQHVNEGVVEWPPSPWRVLRALIAVWHHKAKHEIDEEVLVSLIERLSETLPEYHLPEATAGHTRHYMPYIEGKKQKTTKVFDTFAQIASGQSLLIHWAVELPAETCGALKVLVEHMNYFGRAESLVEITTANDLEDANSFPVGEGYSKSSDQEIIRILAPYPASQYEAWREGFSQGAEVKKKGSRKPKTIAISGTLFEALHNDTSDWKGNGWNRPPGSRWVYYVRPRDVFTPVSVSRPSRRTKRTLTVARFTLSGNVLPSIREAVSVAERFHAALVKWSDSAQVFTGRDQLGKPLRSHQHAHIFCEPEPSGRLIQEVTIYAPAGFTVEARKALEKLRGVWGRGGHNLKVVLSFMGEVEDAKELTPLFGSSCQWASLTPFIPTRHPKTFRNGRPKVDGTGIQIGSPEHDLRRLLCVQKFPNPLLLEKVGRYQFANTNMRWLQFMQRRKRGEGRRAHTCLGTGFRITFSEPVHGPIALGYGAHFGLGLFAPVSETAT